MLPSPRRYHVTTFGCQMNKADSERMAGILDDMGMVWEEDPLAADLVLYNTCTIRDSAEQKVYSYLGRQAKRKQEDPSLTLIVAGCVAQQEGETLLRRVPELDLVMGPQHANRLQDLLEDVFQGNQVVATEPVHIMEDITKPRRGSDVTAWVNVISNSSEVSKHSYNFPATIKSSRALLYLSILVDCCSDLSQSSPSHFISFLIAWVYSSLLRAASVSSIRSMNSPPFACANNQLIIAVLAFPT